MPIIKERTMGQIFQEMSAVPAGHPWQPINTVPKDRAVIFGADVAGKNITTTGYIHEAELMDWVPTRWIDFHIAEAYLVFKNLDTAMDTV